MTPEPALSTERDAHNGVGDGSRRGTLDASSLADRVYRLLREEILRCVHAPGARLDIQALARDLGISTAPLRDAVRRLETDGLVSIHPRRGTYVTEVSPDDVREAYEVRRIIESAAARKVAVALNAGDRAAMEALLAEAELQLGKGAGLDYDRFIRLDAAFHHRLMEAAGNRRLTRFHESLHAHTQIVRAKYTAGIARGRQALREHRAILDALRAGNPADAEHAVGTHLDAALVDLMSHVQAMTRARSAEQPQREGRAIA